MSVNFKACVQDSLSFKNVQGVEPWHQLVRGRLVRQDPYVVSLFDEHCIELGVPGSH